MDENTIFEAIENNNHELLETFLKNPPQTFDFFRKIFKNNKENTFLELMIQKIIYFSINDFTGNYQTKIKIWENFTLQLCKIVNERELEHNHFYLDWSLYKYVSEIKKKEYLNEDFCVEIFHSNYCKKNIFYVEKIMIEVIRHNMNRLAILLFERFPDFLQKDVSSENKKITLFNYSLFSKNRWATQYLFEDMKKKIDSIDKEIIIQNFIYSCNLYFYFKEYSLFLLDYLIHNKIFIFTKMDKTLLMILIENSMELEALKVLDHKDCQENFRSIDFLSPTPSIFGMRFGIQKDAFYFACEKNSIQIIKKLIWKLPLTKFISIRDDFQQRKWGELNLLTIENRPRVLDFIKMKEDFIKEYYGIQDFHPLLMGKIYSYVSNES